MLERTAYRIFPIIKEVQAKMVAHKIDGNTPTNPFNQNSQTSNFDKNSEDYVVNMKALLGYLN